MLLNGAVPGVAIVAETASVVVKAAGAAAARTVVGALQPAGCHRRGGGPSGPGGRCRAYSSSSSSCLDSEVFRTAPPYLLIAPTALSGVACPTLRHTAEVPGFSISRTWSWI